MRTRHGSGVLLAMQGDADQSNEHVVRVFAPPPGECAGENTWENAVKALAGRLKPRLGDAVRFETVHLFSKQFFEHPEVMAMVQNGEAAAPIVTLNGELLQSGGKLSERKIREALEVALAAERPGGVHADGAARSGGERPGGANNTQRTQGA